MRIAITSEGKELNANLDPRFGRSAYYIIVDPETMAIEIVENSQNLNLPQGAGIQAGKIIADNKVDVVITGHDFMDDTYVYPVFEQISLLPSEEESISFDLELGGLRSLSSPQERGAFFGLHRGHVVPDRIV